VWALSASCARASPHLWLVADAAAPRRTTGEPRLAGRAARCRAGCAGARARRLRVTHAPQHERCARPRPRARLAHCVTCLCGASHRLFCAPRTPHGLTSNPLHVTSQSSWRCAASPRCARRCSAQPDTRHTHRHLTRACLTPSLAVLLRRRREGRCARGGAVLRLQRREAGGAGGRRRALQGLHHRQPEAEPQYGASQRPVRNGTTAPVSPVGTAAAASPEPRDWALRLRCGQACFLLRHGRRARARMRGVLHGRQFCDSDSVAYRRSRRRRSHCPQVYAPLTRSRALGGIPGENAVTYYSQVRASPHSSCAAAAGPWADAGAPAPHRLQRASKGGFMISEASPVCETGHGYPCTPGVHTAEQARGAASVDPQNTHEAYTVRLRCAADALAPRAGGGLEARDGGDPREGRENLLPGTPRRARVCGAHTHAATLLAPSLPHSAR
jgi:hypothetical protein